MTARAAGGRAATASFAGSVLLSAVALFAPQAPGPALVDVPGQDKVVHAVLFTLLAATARWAYGRPAVVVLALAAYGATSELAQAWWLDDRGGDLLDLAADLVGVAVGTALAGGWRPSVMGSVVDDVPT